MASNVKGGEGIILIPRGDPNEIEIIVVKRRGIVRRALNMVIKVIVFTITALIAGLVSGFGDALSKLFQTF